MTETLRPDALVEARIEHLLEQVEQSETAEVRSARLFELARIYEHERGDAQRAFTTLLALDLDVHAPVCADDLARLAATTDRWPELAEAFEAAAAGATVPERRAALFVEAGSILRRCGELEHARACCRRALEAVPTSRNAMAALERIAREHGDLDELLAVFDRRIAASVEEERLLVQREAAANCVVSNRHDEAIRRYEEIRADIPADLDTLRALARLYELGHPSKHLDVLSALSGVLPEGKEHMSVHRQLAVAWEALGDRTRATEALEWVIAAGGADDATYGTLCRLYLADERWCAAVDAISRHAERVSPELRGPMYLQLGMIYEEHVEDRWRAIDCYDKANELVPGSESTLVALARLCESTEANERAARHLEAAAQLARTPSARTGRLTRAGELLIAQRDGTDRTAWAERLLSEALALQPGYPPAARALAELHLARGERQAAIDLLGGAVMHAADEDERSDLLLSIGQLEEAMGHREQALGCYRRALEATPARRDVEVRACDVLFALGLDAEVLPLLERLCADEPDLAVRADRLVRLARVLEALGARPRAFSALEHARAIVPGHLDARRFEGELLFADGRWLAARTLLEQVVAEDAGELSARDLANIQARIGAAAMALHDSSGALIALEEAIHLEPQHLVALKRALEIYAEHARWTDALAVAKRIASLEPEAKLRARYWHVAARICDEELRDGEEALACYGRVIEEDPEHAAASTSIERLLELRGDRDGLLAHYTRRIQQLGPVGGPADGERQRLWTALAETCDAMGDREAARIALEVSTTIDGSQLDLRARLADACISGGQDHLERAISEHQQILLRKQDRLSSYRTLAELYARTGRPERAQDLREAHDCLVVHGLGEDAGTAGAILGAEVQPVQLAQRPLTAQDWAALVHPDENTQLSALWSGIAPLIAGLEASTHRAIGLRPRDAVRGDDTRPFARAAREASRLLGVACPELHVRGDEMRAAKFVNLRTEVALNPVLFVGVPVLGDRRRLPELLFTFGLQLARVRPERLLRLALPDAAALAFVIDAVRDVAAEVDGVRKAHPSRTIDGLRKLMTPLAFDQMVGIGRRLTRQGEPATAMATAWLRAADLSAARAALALTGDLASAMRVLAADEQSFVDPRERLLDLAWSSITDTFATVRARVVDTASTNRRSWPATGDVVALA